MNATHNCTVVLNISQFLVVLLFSTSALLLMWYCLITVLRLEQLGMAKKKKHTMKPSCVRICLFSINKQVSMTKYLELFYKKQKTKHKPPHHLSPNKEEASKSRPTECYSLHHHATPYRKTFILSTWPVNCLHSPHTPF